MALSIHSSGLEDEGESREGRWREVHPRIYPPCVQAATRAVSAVTSPPCVLPPWWEGSAGDPCIPLNPLPVAAQCEPFMSACLSKWCSVGTACYPQPFYRAWGPEAGGEGEPRPMRLTTWLALTHNNTSLPTLHDLLVFLAPFSPGVALDSSIFGTPSHLIWLRKSRVEGLIRAKE